MRATGFAPATLSLGGVAGRVIPRASGGPVTSFAFQQVLDDHNVRGSIGSVGDAYDNSMAESFVDTFKIELSDRVWRTRTQLELAIVEWVAWFNNDRLHESLSDVPPAEIEAGTLPGAGVDLGEALTLRL